MIYDKDFLLELDKIKNKIVHARVTALTFDEQPIETIEGRVTQGSISVDGNSAVRRTCSLTMVAKNFNYQNYYWGLNTKFKLEIGVENYINPLYPDIIWFKQGIYVFTSFNTSRNASSFNISLQGKDKMCLLNGEVGGSLESSIDFANIEEENADGVWTITPIPVYDIIRNAVHTYAGEPYHNIIINDIEDYGLELLEYRYDIPLFLYRKATSDTVQDWQESPIFDNILMGGNLVCQVDRYDEEVQSYIRVETTVNELMPTELDMLVDSLMGTSEPAKIWIYDEVYKDYMPWYFARVDYGQTAGYRLTDLTYAGELIANVGEAITSVLDKIKNMLSEFEYFYDLDGQFVFQRKRAFINTLWSPEATAETEDLDENGNSIYYSEKYVQSIANASSWAYVFNDGELISAFNNNPNLLNMRNDFSVWGARKGISGADIPVHLRYAIDIKPTYYTSFDGITYTVRTEEEVEEDRKAFEFSIVDNGYKKEPSRFGLSEDWWEVRDWAKAWVHSGLEIPTSTLGTYCPVKSIVYSSDGPVPTIPSNSWYPCELTEVKASEFDKWGTSWTKSSQTDDLVFTSDGKFWTYHGTCGHTYGEWLDFFEDGGWYAGGYAYFYKPQIPADEITNGQGLILGEQIKYNLDWRELIYQMAKDYYQHNTEDDFELKLRESNINFFPTGKTGYERYYIDIQGFWRQLYNPFLDDDKTTYLGKITAEENYLTFLDRFTTAWNRYLGATEGSALANRYYETFLNMFTHDSMSRFVLENEGFESYFYWKYADDEEDSEEGEETEEEDEVTDEEESEEEDEVTDEEESEEEEEGEKVYLGIQEGMVDALVQAIFMEVTTVNQKIDDYEAKIENIENQFDNYYPKDHKHEYWLKNVYEYPETLNFWFDFLDGEGELAQFNVKNVGARSKAINETTIKSIYFRETPDVIFKSPGDPIQPLSGYKYIQVQDIDSMFSISAQGKSAKDRLDELIYNHGYCIENATITTVPIYYLEPNVRVHIHDEETNLNGDYIISKMTIPLAYNGTMQLTATKAAESII